MTRPATSAIVVSYRTGPRLRDCLYVLSSDPEVDEILLIDNGNPPEDTAWIDHFAGNYPKIKLRRPGENLGFGKAANLGAREACGELLIVINPDAMIRRGSVGALWQAGKNQPSPSGSELTSAGSSSSAALPSVTTPSTGA